jgi:hypothetical protein
VTLPVPASTDPAADAAAHIGALADAITARLSSRSVAYWAGTVTANAYGDFAVPGIAGVLSYCTGAVVTDTGAAGLADSARPHLYRFIQAGPPGTALIRLHTAAGVPIGPASLGVSVIAWGTPA